MPRWARAGGEKRAGAGRQPFRPSEDRGKLSHPAGAQRWPRGTVVCIASGPSLTAEDVETARLAHAAGRVRVITVNAACSPYGWAPWADVLYAADEKFWREYHQDIARAFRGERWTVSPAAAHNYGLHFIRTDDGDGLSRDPTMIFGGRNSGYQAAHLAINFGAVRLGLLGYDMQRTGGRSHNHGDHRGKLRNPTNFASWCERFAVFAQHARAAGIEVVNCTRTSALDCFPRMTIAEFLA